MRPTAAELTGWLSMDVAARRDSKGIGPKQGYRRYRSGRQMLIYSKKVLDLNSADTVWGICYQHNDKRVRGDDLLLRLTLAVLAYEEEGNSRQAACRNVASVPGVARICGYKGTMNEISCFRVRVIQYLKRMRRQNICIENDLRRMRELWCWRHLEEMRGSEWYNNLLEEFRARVVRVDEEIQKCSDPEERGVLNRLRLSHCGALALELHDSKRFEEAREYYEVVIEGLDDSSGDLNSKVMLDWYMEQSERCKRKEPREHTPVLMDGRVTRIG